MFLQILKTSDVKLSFQRNACVLQRVDIYP